MMQPLPGDFVLLPVHGDAGLAIRLGQWLNGGGFSRYQHAEIYVGQPDQAGPHGYTISAYPDGNGRRPLPCPAGELPGALWSAGRLELTHDNRLGLIITGRQRDLIVAWCTACAHVRYGWLDYLALASRRLHLPVPFLREEIASTRTMICSQYVAYAYHVAGVDLFPGEWTGYVTPADLAALLERQGSAA